MSNKNPIIDQHETKRWFKNDNLHREDGPAVEYSNGDKFWYKEGKSHRLDGPAIEYANGTKEWLQGGKLHRLDGPAVKYADGNKEWCYKEKYMHCSSQEKFEQLLTLIMFW